ncbi:MAG: PIN domain-containing protein [Actinomycetota bacterium]
MRAIDTNVLVRLLVQDDLQQLEIAEQFVGGGAWISHLALVEASWVLDTVYEVGAKRIAEALEMLLNHLNLAIQDADVVAAAVEQFRRAPQVEFADHLILQTARKAGNLPMGSFDRRFARLEGAEQLE